MVSNNKIISANHSCLSIIQPADTYTNACEIEKSDKTLPLYILLENKLQNLSCLSLFT